MLWAVVCALLYLQQPDYQAEGMKALDAKNYAGAAEIFSKAVAADPKDYAAHFNLALSYSLLGKDVEAENEYRTTLELKPHLYQAELNLGMLLLRAKQPAPSVSLLKDAAEQKPKEFRPAFYFAEALFGTGDAAGAEQAYKAALEINPTSAPAELGLGRALAKQNRLADAAPHFHKAAELDPNFKDALLELAGLEETAHQNEAAIAIYRRFPDDAGAQERLGNLLLAAGRPADAVGPLETAVRKSPTAANRLALAEAYLKTQQPDKGIPLIEQAVQAEPGNYALRMLYGRTLRDQHKYVEAAPQFLAATRLKRDSAEAWSELAGVLILSENYPQALAALDRVKALGAETGAHFFFRAIVLDKLHEVRGALENYQKFLAADQGKSPNEDFKARQRIRILERELHQ